MKKGEEPSPTGKRIVKRVESDLGGLFDKPDKSPGNREIKRVNTELISRMDTDGGARVETEAGLRFETE